MFQAGDIVTAGSEVYIVERVHPDRHEDLVTGDTYYLIDVVHEATGRPYSRQNSFNFSLSHKGGMAKLITAYGREFKLNVIKALDIAGMRYTTKKDDAGSHITHFNVAKSDLAKAQKAIDDFYSAQK